MSIGDRIGHLNLYAGRRFEILQHFGAPLEILLQHRRSRLMRPDRFVPEAAMMQADFDFHRCARRLGAGQRASVLASHFRLV